MLGDADCFLNSGQTGHVEEVGLVVDEEVAQLVGFFSQVLTVQDADSVV